MLNSQRKQFLLDTLQRDGQLVATSLAASLGVSEDTIRRDLRELAREGRVQRVHGGALPASPAMGDVAARSQIATADKARIGRLAAGLIAPGQVVFLDGGTTALQLAAQLPPGLRATIVTHSPAVAMALAEHPGIDVLILGGRLFRHSMVAMGASTVAQIAAIRADLYIMGVCSVDPEAGLSTGDFDEAAVKRAMLDAAARTIVLASPEKLHTASPFAVAALAEVDALVCSAAEPPERLEAFRTAGLALHLA